MQLENMSADEIEELKVRAEKELRSANEHYGIVRQQKLEIDRQILEIKIKQSDYVIMCSKARDVIKRLMSDIKILETEFWRKAKGRA